MLTEKDKAALSWAERMGILPKTEVLKEGEDYEVIE